MAGINFIKYPNKIPNKQKSESEKAVPDKLKLPNSGIMRSDKTEINIPCAKEPITQPRVPPFAFANTPALPPQKKWETTPGTMTGK